MADDYGPKEILGIVHLCVQCGAPVLCKLGTDPATVVCPRNEHQRLAPVETSPPYRVPGTFEKCDHPIEAWAGRGPVEHPMNHYRCACTGCWACYGKQLDCTCDIDWERLYAR